MEMFRDFYILDLERNCRFNIRCNRCGVTAYFKNLKNAYEELTAKNWKLELRTNALLCPDCVEIVKIKGKYWG
ncbi:MAG TPA: hypothetical protein PKV92_09035 [Thermodesulfovibrio thiophilus]|nr:hypothetical protein [Thermodesulfovibrio thiophilus]HQD37222.1 hypothetical protein [Thermodesulfovibrio thiophilus]